MEKLTNLALGDLVKTTVTGRVVGLEVTSNNKVRVEIKGDSGAHLWVYQDEIEEVIGARD